MLTLVVRRALVQRRLLTAVVVLVAAAATLMGVCALLLGATQQRAFHVEVERSPAQDVDVTAFLVDVSRSDVQGAEAAAERVVRDLLAPMRPTVTSTVTARMRQLGGPDRLAYLASSDDLAQRADLTAGRWPSPGSGPPEAVVPEATARLLDLGVGDRVTLGHEIGLDGADQPVTVELVGTFRPRARAGWETDPLSGTGADPAYSDGSVTAPAYGPFMVGDTELLATGSSVSGLRVTAHPTLTLAEDSSLRAAADALGHASALLSSRVDDRARITRVASDLPRTLDRVHAEQASTRATVLVVLLLGTALSVAAVLLAGWLIASVRDDEQALLASLGLSRRQQVGASVVEALLVAAAAAVLAVPAAAVVHSRLTRSTDLRAAGLAQSPTITAGLVLTVLGGALLLALVLVVTALEVPLAPDPTARRWAVARSGLDVLLVVAAAVGWWQLRAQPASGTTSTDVTLTVAPVVCVAAVTVVVVRLVPLLLAAAARAGVRSRSLVLPLATQQAARRPHTATAMVLLAAAVAAAVFGLALRTTWERSQEDQAALRVGTDLALVLPAPAGLQDAAEVAAATGAQTPEPVVSAVIDRPLVLGRYVGDVGSPPVLVAVDSRRAGALLRGRLESGTSWREVGAALAPAAPVQGLPLLDGGAPVELLARAPAGTALTVTATAVLQDPAGFRSSLVARPEPADGRPHPVEWLGRVGPGQRLVGVRLELEGPPPADYDDQTSAPVEVSVTLRVPGPDATGDDAWQVRPLQRDSPVRGAQVSVGPTEGGVELRTTVGLDLAYFAYTGADLLATAFPAPQDVPVAVSQDLADAVGTEVGAELSATVGAAVLPLRVAAIVPTVPSAPGRVAVLADADTLSRALVATGRLDPVVDAWWVADPSPQTVRALQSLELGEVTTRRGVADELAQGPLRVTVPAALLTLVVAAVVMLLAGVGLVLSADRQRRRAEVARLRALGLTRRDARRLLLAEHAAFVVPLVVVGALVGSAAALLLGPLLIRSDVGAAPVPDAVVAWPWPAEALLLGGVLLGSLALTAVASAFHVGRSDPVHVRTGEW